MLFVLPLSAIDHTTTRIDHRPGKIEGKGQSMVVLRNGSNDAQKVGSHFKKQTSVCGVNVMCNGVRILHYASFQTVMVFRHPFFPTHCA